MIDVASGSTVLSAEEYKSIFRTHPAGVTIVTLNDCGRPVGFTATSVVSVSANPPIIVFSIIGTSSSWPALSQARSVVLHFLDEQDVQLSQRFATSGVDRFDGIAWRSLNSGEPLLETHGTWVRCEVVAIHSVGGSYMVQVAPTHAHIDDERAALVYHDRAYHRLGNSSVLNV